MQTPPPNATNGSGVEHEPVGGAADTGSGATGCGCAAGTDAAAAIGESGGTQPPFTQTQVAAGFMVVQVLGAVFTGTTGATVVSGAGALGAGMAGASARG